MDQFAALEVVNDSADRYFEDDIIAGLAAAVGTFAMASALRVVLGVEAEVDERVVRLARLHDHVTALAPVTSAGATARDELLPAECHASVSAATGVDPNSRFIYEHGKTSY